MFYPTRNTEKMSGQEEREDGNVSGLKLEKPNSRDSSMGQQTNKEYYLHEMIKLFAVI